MRLHHLSMTAFGPFPGTESVDFDALNDAGLFLLSGATGAGKTSILDAVCFALYGSVPGVRGVKTLKSQHADETTAPEVVLEFSVRDRRFRVRRSPEWTRPKLRGAGTRTENARASLLELTSGEEHLLSSRAAEVGLLVADLVGMRAAQFHQVAMLPQGEFQKFLHASSQERHDVLQHLFRTDRFARIEEWVHDHSRALRADAERAEEQVRRLLHTIADRAGVGLLTDIGGGGDGTADEGSGVGSTTGQEDNREADAETSGAGPADERLPEDGGLSWVHQVVAAVRSEHDAAARRRREADETVAATRDRLDRERAVAELLRRRAEAHTALVELEATAPEAADVAARLDDHRRAATCTSVLDLIEAARADLASASATRDRALTALCSRDLGTARAVVPGELLEDLSGLDVDGLDRLVEVVRGQAVRVEALLPRARAAADLVEQVERTRTALAAAQQEAEEATRVRDDLPVRLAEQRERVEELTGVAAGADALELRLAAARERAEAAAALPGAQTTLAAATDRQRDCRDAAADAREQVQDLRARRLAGMAAELAGALQDGVPCQVCGSPEHPRPAEPSPSRVDAAEQDDADRAYERAQAELLAAAETLAAAEAEVVSLRRAADGRTLADARAEVVALTAELAQAREAGRRRDATLAELAELETAQTTADGRCAETVRRRDALAERLSAENDALARARGDLAAALPRVPPDDLDHLAAIAADLDGLLEALVGTRVALVRHEQAARRCADLDRQAVQSAHGQGFSSLDDLCAALLPDEEQQRLDRWLADRAERAGIARAALDAPELAGLEPDVLTDVDGAARALAAADLTAREAARDADLLAARLGALAALSERLEAAVERWLPAREKHARADGMARLVRGMGTDNHLQMRLSAYVLATRLDQVLDAANERLAQMRDQRYLLQRTGRAARKGSQAGLGLEVVDQWTGDVRDPATLSGGETFVVSLSLALGLADVVTVEAGGTEIETLFVDEGFGTLDPDTLDDVMDRLDGLRAGGRTVGVVSHVGELRTRIPAQVHVRKTPRGSTVRIETLVG